MIEKNWEPYLETYSGKKFYFLEPKPEMVDIEDIAHALSMQCRFNGHCTEFYSVAQHSLHVADILDREFHDPGLTLAGLLHDAAEAYCCDIPSPIKQHLESYRVIEDDIQTVIAEKFGLLGYFGDERIKRADFSQLLMEAQCLMKSRGVGWKVSWEEGDLLPIRKVLVPMTQQQSKCGFQDAFVHFALKHYCFMINQKCSN